MRRSFYDDVKLSVLYDLYIAGSEGLFWISICPVKRPLPFVNPGRLVLLGEEGYAVGNDCGRCRKHQNWFAGYP